MSELNQSLQKTIEMDLSLATFKKDKETKELLKVLVSEMSRGESKILSDEEVIRIVRKQKESAIKCNTLSEIPILERYLPQMLSENAIKIIVQGIISKNGYTSISDMGSVMKDLKSHEQSDLIPGKISSAVVRELLK
jgi:hypothetical protein